MFVDSVGYSSVGLADVAAGTLGAGNFVYSMGFIGDGIFGGAEEVGYFVVGCKNRFYVLFLKNSTDFIGYTLDIRKESFWCRVSCSVGVFCSVGGCCGVVGNLTVWVYCLFYMSVNERGIVAVSVENVRKIL